jgi:hypothetical protein
MAFEANLNQSKQAAAEQTKKQAAAKQTFVFVQAYTK